MSSEADTELTQLLFPVIVKMKLVAYLNTTWHKPRKHRHRQTDIWLHDGLSNVSLVLLLPVAKYSTSISPDFISSFQEQPHLPATTLIPCGLQLLPVIRPDFELDYACLSCLFMVFICTFMLLFAWCSQVTGRLSQIWLSSSDLPLLLHFSMITSVCAHFSVLKLHSCALYSRHNLQMKRRAAFLLLRCSTLSQVDTH